MNALSVFSACNNIYKWIYSLWSQAILNNSQQALNEINKLLDNNEKLLTTKEYSKQAFRARVVEPKDYSDIIINTKKKFIIDEFMCGDSGIFGFPSDKMGVPPIDIIKNGRANKEHKQCLYLASDIQTACSEVQPACESLISVIKFTLKSDLTLIDLRSIPDELKSYNNNEHTEKLINIIFCQSLLHIFSMPIISSEKSVYCYSQYIADYYSKKNIDGILYNSSHNYNNDAYNIVLFDPNNAATCEPHGELFKCLTIKTTYQSVSKNYRTEKDVEILEAKREQSPNLWTDNILLCQSLTD